MLDKNGNPQAASGTPVLPYSTIRPISSSNETTATDDIERFQLGLLAINVIDYMRKHMVPKLENGMPTNTSFPLTVDQAREVLIIALELVNKNEKRSWINEEIP